MKIFRTFRKNVKAGGFNRDQGAFSEVQLQTIFKAFISFILQCVYLFHVANTPRQYLDSIFMTTAGFLIVISYISFVFKTTELFDFIDDFEQTINERLKYPNSIVYGKTNDLVEKIGEIVHFFMVYVSAPGFVLPKAIYNFFMYFVIDSGSDAYELPFPMWVPFNWENPIRYSIAIILQISIVAYTLYYISTFTSFAIGTYLFSMPITKEVKHMIESYNDSLKTKQSHEQMMKKFSEIICFTHFKQLFFGLIDLFQITLVVVFLGCTGAIGLALMMIQQQLLHNDTDSIVLFESIFCGFWALMLVFIACEFTQRVSNAYDAIGVAFNNIDWHLVPNGVHMHKVFLISLMYTQRPLECEFFGSISCSREQFKRVIYKGYNAFMVLRSLY